MRPNEVNPSDRALISGLDTLTAEHYFYHSDDVTAALDAEKAAM